jgi:hypothetical protein
MICGICPKRHGHSGETWCVTTSQQPPQGQYPSQNPYEQPQGQYGSPAGGWPPPQPPAAAPKNGLGTTALVLGIIGALFSFIPFVGVIAWPLVILGLIFGIIGFFRARSGKANNRGVAIAGTVLSLIGLVICVMYASAFTSAVANLPAPPASAPVAGQQQPAQAPAAAPPADAGGGDVVTYEVTGSGKATNVTYTKDKNMGQEQVASASLPWSKQVTFGGGAFSFQPLSLIAQNGQSGGDITCKISKNGQEITSSTSSGPFAVVTCSGN